MSTFDEATDPTTPPGPDTFGPDSFGPETFGPVGGTTPALRFAVEEFLYHEADLLDTWRLDEWLDLFTEECLFLMPSTDRPDGDPFTEMFLIQDDRFLLEQRVDSLMTKTAWAESPHSTMRHFVTNVRAVHLGDGAVEATANVLVTRSRRDNVDTYPARYEMLLQAYTAATSGADAKPRHPAARFRIKTRKAILALEELRPHGRVSFIL